MALQGFSVALGSFDDSPHNYLPNTNIEIRKDEAGEPLATIYADRDGLTPIAQPGAKTNSEGVFIFYAEAGQYLARHTVDAQVFSTPVGSAGVNHGQTIDKDEPGSAHDQIYRRKTTVAEILTGVFSIGDRLEIVDRDNAHAVMTAGAPDGYGKIDGLNGIVALIENDSGYAIASHYGAIGGADASIADSSGAIQAAWNTGDPVLLTKPHYKINTALNFTHALAGGRGLFGVIGGISRNGVVIHLNTGGVGIDCTGSQRIPISNITLDTSDPLLTNPSTVAVLNARSTTSQYAQFNTFSSVTILMHDSPSANGGAGTIGICNIASEITDYENIYVSANTPLSITSTNVHGVVSPYQTIGGPTSCSNFKFSGTCVLNARGTNSYSLWLQSAAVLDGMLYLSRSGGSYAGTYAIKASGSMDAVKLFCQVEFHERVGLLGNGCDGLEIHATKAVGANSPFVTDTGFVGISRCKLRVDNILAIPATAPYILEGKAGDIVSDCELISKVWEPATSPTNIASTSYSSDTATNKKRHRLSQIRFENTETVTDSQTLGYFARGSFTPTVVGATAAGTASYTIQGGKWQRVGDVVTVQVALAWTGFTGTGAMYISGLPFPANSAPASRCSLSIKVSSLPGVTGVPQVSSRDGQQQLELHQFSAGSGSAISGVASGTIFITGEYWV